jgi:predicted nucleotidyltransferase component of viral defense system
MKFGAKKPVSGIENNMILSPRQKDFLRFFAGSELSEIFRLSGGTALSAFYLEHRVSDNLSFFSFKKVPFYMIGSFLNSLEFVDKVHLARMYEKNIFTIRLNDGSILRAEFTYYPLKNIESTNILDALQIDSFNDIVANKLCAIADRNDAKDYADVYCAVKDQPDILLELLVFTEKKCEVGGIRDILRSRLLQVPEGVEKLSMKIEVNSLELEEFFTTFVRKNVKKIVESRV